MKCNKCSLDLEPQFFHRAIAKSRGYSYTCKACSNARRKRWYADHKEHSTEAGKAWRLKHPDEHKANNALWRQANRESHLARKRAYYAENKPRIRAEQAVYARKNRKAINKRMRAYQKARSAVDINYRLSRTLRCRLRGAIVNSQRSGSAVRDLGCDIPTFKTYIESKFLPGMAWDNWGTRGWHLDHIIPLVRFDLTDRNQLLAATHYTNLQPLWARDNLVKDTGKRRITNLP